MMSTARELPAAAPATGSRYDYRAAWLRFLDCLSVEGDVSAHALAGRIAEAALAITSCRAACLWQIDVDATLNWRASAGVPPPSALVVAAPEVVAVLSKDRPVESATAFAARLGGTLPPWLDVGGRPWAIVTFCHRGRPLALLALAPPSDQRPLDEEDQALLAIFGAAAASHLAEAEARETLEDMRAVDAFNRRVAFVLHDIKNVAAKLSLALDNARRLQGNPEFYEDLLGTIAHAVRRLESLRARLEVQPSGTRREPVPLHRLVRQACARVGRILRLEEPLPEVWLWGDAAILEAAIGNLLANAREAAGETGIVAVRLERWSDRAVLEISDSGPGIPPGLAARGLFRPFSTGRSGGTGLGLFGVRDAVRRAGGQIEIETGTGTRVRLILPLAEVGA
jgi:putative PEP-CTERM system histidine kinase